MVTSSACFDLAQVGVERPAEVGEIAVVERRERDFDGGRRQGEGIDCGRAIAGGKGRAGASGRSASPGAPAAPSAPRRSSPASRRGARAPPPSARACPAPARARRESRCASARSSARASAGIDPAGRSSDARDPHRVLALQVAARERDVAAGASSLQIAACSVAYSSDRRSACVGSSTLASLFTSRCATRLAHQLREHRRAASPAPAGRRRRRSTAACGPSSRASSMSNDDTAIRRRKRRREAEAVGGKHLGGDQRERRALLVDATGVSGSRPLPARSRSVVSPPMYFAAYSAPCDASASPRVKLRRRTE